MQPSAIIFDCDGVLVDSEVLAAQVLIDVLAELGHPISHAEVSARYVGKTIDGVIDITRELFGDRAGDVVARDLTRRTMRAFETDLKPIAGILELLQKIEQSRVVRAVASSSAPERLAVSLRVSGVAPFFGPHVYSASMVTHPKPAPDLYLLAASRLNVDPARCIVIEDSPTGAKAGVAAGMKVIGFTGGSHVGPGQSQRLMDAGVVAVAPDMPAVAARLADLGPILP